MTFHLIWSLDGPTDSVGIPAFLLVSRVKTPIVARLSPAGHVPLRGGRVVSASSVRPSVRPSIWPIEATSATKHLTFSRSIVELYRKRRNKFLGSPPTTAAAATATSSSPRISPISARRSKVNEIAKLNRKGSAVRGVFDGGWKRAERAGIFFSEGIIKWAGNYCFPSLFLVQP